MSPQGVIGEIESKTCTMPWLMSSGVCWLGRLPDPRSVATAAVALAQLGRVEQEEELMKHLAQCVTGDAARTGVPWGYTRQVLVGLGLFWGDRTCSFIC